MRPLYGEKELKALRRHHVRWRAVALLTGAAALTVIILLILFTRTLTAARNELLSVGVSTLGGWIVLYALLFKILPDRREEAHAAFLVKDPPESAEGELTLTPERVRIARSITARRVELKGEGGPRRLLVCETRAADLEAAAPRRVYVSHGYIAGWEERV